MCLNLDEAFKRGVGASCAGLYRDNQGVWLGGFHKYIGDCNNLATELWDVMLGLELA